jgi:hypothetical protein
MAAVEHVLECAKPTRQSAEGVRIAAATRELSQALCKLRMAREDVKAAAHAGSQALIVERCEASLEPSAEGRAAFLKWREG